MSPPCESMGSVCPAKLQVTKARHMSMFGKMEMLDLEILELMKVPTRDEQIHLHLFGSMNQHLKSHRLWVDMLAPHQQSEVTKRFDRTPCRTGAAGLSLLGAKGIATRSKDATFGAPGLTTRNKKLLGTKEDFAGPLSECVGSALPIQPLASVAFSACSISATASSESTFRMHPDSTAQDCPYTALVDEPI